MSYEIRTAKANVNAYLNSTMFHLLDAYQRFSQNKANAWDYCESLMAKKNGHDLKVISKNTFIFTAGFLFEEDGKEMFMFITPNYDQAVEM